jgi:hypothetical protein
VAAQDQAVGMNSLKIKVRRQKLLVNAEHKDTTDHLIPGSPILAKNGKRQSWCKFKSFNTHPKDRKMERALNTHTSQHVNTEMKHCHEIKGYTQPQNLRQIGHI